MEKKNISKRKRKSCADELAEEYKTKKKRMSTLLKDSGTDAEVECDAEEHSRLLGLVTGRIEKLPLEDAAKESSENTYETNGKKEKKARNSRGDDEQEKAESEVNCVKLSVDKASAAEYLVLWDTDRSSWSFKKKTQYWLLQNMYFKEHVSTSYCIFC